MGSGEALAALEMSSPDGHERRGGLRDAERRVPCGSPRQAPNQASDCAQSGVRSARQGKSCGQVLYRRAGITVRLLRTTERRRLPRSSTSTSSTGTPLGAEIPEYALHWREPVPLLLHD